MQFLALSALALTLIGRCLAEPIPIDAMHRDDLVARTPALPPPFNSLPASDPKAFWPCFRCMTECTTVVAGCSLVCLVAEFQPELCGLCIAGAGGSKACVDCFPRCREHQSFQMLINGRPFKPVKPF